MEETNARGTSPFFKGTSASAMCLFFTVPLAAPQRCCFSDPSFPRLASWPSVVASGLGARNKRASNPFSPRSCRNLARLPCPKPHGKSYKSRRVLRLKGYYDSGVSLGCEKQLLPPEQRGRANYRVLLAVQKERRERRRKVGQC